jgi:HSP20 family protein
MKTLEKRDSLFPTWTNSLFNTGDFLTPKWMDFYLPELDFTNKIPAANITESPKEFVIELAVPGLERKDFKVEVNNGILFISSEKEEESNEVKKNYTRKEYAYNSFSRSFTLPENLILEKINAKYENGILHVMLPKKEVTVAKPSKQIKIS